MDIEQLMFGLHKFKHLNVLRVAAADIMGAAPLMVVSDYLTYIAEVIILTNPRASSNQFNHLL
jgi:glutamate-ammonia-ligase adenylyltransferase